jgi:hypothetical protein
LYFMALAAVAVTGRAAATEPLHETIDRLVEAALPVPPAPAAGDAEFVRRVSLDLTNRIATADEVRAFLKDPAPDKRAALVEKLLASPQFSRRLANFLDVTLMERRPDKYVGRAEWEAWLYQTCLDNRPWDQLVRDVLTADGVDPARRAPAKFSLEREADPNLLTRDVGRTFFGRDVQCAQCHNHPNVKDYEQREYYGLLSFFYRTGLQKQPNGTYVLAEKAEGDPTFESVFVKGATHAARPALPGGATVEPAKAGRRDLLARAATAGDNRAFNRNVVNRLWALMMGRGLVQPVDFDHSDNPPTHPELLDRLADEFVAMKYDIRAFLKELALSKTYQRSFDLPPAFDRETASVVGQMPALESAAAKAKEAADAATAAVKAARKEAEAARDRVDGPLKELRAKEADLAKLQKAQAAAAAALAGSRRQIQAKTDAQAAVGKALENAKQALALAATDADLKAVVDKLQAKATQFGTEVKTLTQTAATQGAAAKQADETVQAAEKTVADAAAKVRQADQEVQPILTKYAAAFRAQQQAKAALAECERRLELAKSLATYRTRAEALARIEEHTVPAEREVTAARRVRDDAADRQGANRREIAALDRRLDNLRQAAAAATDTLKRRQQAAGALAAAADQVDRAVAAVKDDEMSHAAGSIRKRGSALAGETAAARKQLADRQAELQTAVARQQQLILEVPALDQAVTAATARVTDLESKHHTPLAELTAARTTHASARQDLLDRLAETYAVAPLKPLTPEQLHWSVLQATGILASYEAAAEAELDKKKPPPAGTERAVVREKDVHAKLAGNLSPFVHLFGGGPGQPQFEFFATADQALFMENGDAVRSWTAVGGPLAHRLSAIPQPAAVADEVYLSVLNRPPTPDETADVAACLARHRGKSAEAASELVWALLASVEFRFGH